MNRLGALVSPEAEGGKRTRDRDHPGPSVERGPATFDGVASKHVQNTTYFPPVFENVSFRRKRTFTTQFPPIFSRFSPKQTFPRAEHAKNILNVPTLANATCVGPSRPRRHDEACQHNRHHDPPGKCLRRVFSSAFSLGLLSRTQKP